MGALAFQVDGAERVPSGAATHWRDSTIGPMMDGMVIAWAALLVAVAGLLLYVLASNPKVVEIGRLMMFAGMLVTTYALGARTIRIP